MKTEIEEKVKNTNVERIVKIARSQSLSNDEIREQRNLYDDVKNVCHATWYFREDESRWGDLTIRDIFEMESLGYDYKILDIY